MTFDEWYDTYTPHEDDNGVLRNYQTYGDDWETVRNTDYHHVWTLVDGDYGTYIVQGRAFVNRIHYLITEKPWLDGEEHCIADQEYGEDEETEDDLEVAL